MTEEADRKMIILMAMMLMAASAKGGLEEEWLPVTVNEKIPIDFKESKFEVMTDFIIGNSAYLRIIFWGKDDEQLVSWGVSVGNAYNSASWKFESCMNSKVEIPSGTLKDYVQVWTIWKRDGKLNVRLDGDKEIVTDAFPGDRDETKCSESDDMYGYPDWERQWNTETIALSIGSSNVNADPTGYRIIPFPAEEDITEPEEAVKDRNKMSSETKISVHNWILVSTLLVCLRLLRHA